MGLGVITRWRLLLCFVSFIRKEGEISPTPSSILASFQWKYIIKDKLLNEVFLVICSASRPDWFRTGTQWDYSDAHMDNRIQVSYYSLEVYGDTVSQWHICCTRMGNYNYFYYCLFMYMVNNSLCNFFFITYLTLWVSPVGFIKFVKLTFIEKEVLIKSDKEIWL